MFGRVFQSTVIEKEIKEKEKEKEPFEVDGYELNESVTPSSFLCCVCKEKHATYYISSAISRPAQRYSYLGTYVCSHECFLLWLLSIE